MIRKASARWTGDLKTGKGQLTTESGTLKDTPFSFHTRFEDGNGTNPEELLGAALAGCFSMALNNNMKMAGHNVEEVVADAKVTMEKVEDKQTITTVHLDVRSRVPGIDQNTYNEFVQKTHEGCIIRRALTAKVIVDAKLLQEA
jgi:osmotically inducible protein OsmC